MLSSSTYLVSFFTFRFLVRVLFHVGHKVQIQSDLFPVGLTPVLGPSDLRCVFHHVLSVHSAWVYF